MVLFTITIPCWFSFVWSNKTWNLLAFLSIRPRNRISWNISNVFIFHSWKLISPNFRVLSLKFYNGGRDCNVSSDNFIPDSMEIASYLNKFLSRSTKKTIKRIFFFVMKFFLVLLFDSKNLFWKIYWKNQEIIFVLSLILNFYYVSIAYTYQVDNRFLVLIERHMLLMYRWFMKF